MAEDMYNAIVAIETSSPKDMEPFSAVCKVKGGGELIAKYFNEKKKLIAV